MEFILNVVRGRGVPRTIELTAPGIEAARREATGLGLTVLSARKVGFQLGLNLSVRSRSADKLDVAVFIEQLRDLLLAGLSVIEALNALRRGARGSAVSVIERLERQLQEGKTLSDAFAAPLPTSIYPLLLIGVGSLVMLFLLFYVMPRFACIFEGMTSDLPWSARLM
jgi:general secretion pathway protein F